MREVSFDEGEWVVRRGLVDVGLHVIVDGEAGVVLNDEELAVLPKGSFFGEISALLDEADGRGRRRAGAAPVSLRPAGRGGRLPALPPEGDAPHARDRGARLRTTDELRT